MNKLIPIITCSLFLLSACGGSESEDQLKLEDSDNDTIVNTQDNCPFVPNTDQADSDENGIGDACESVNLKEQALEKISKYAKSGGTTLTPSMQDYIDAGVVGVTSEKLTEVNQTIASLDEEDVDTQAEVQNILDNLNIVIPDFDADGINNDVDNCPAISNPNQNDSDNDGKGDACDLVLVSINATNITENSAKVSWDLNTYATGYVKYGTTNSYGNETIKETSFDYKSHTQNIGNLLPDTTYHYQIVSISADGNTITSADKTFKTTKALTPANEMDSSLNMGGLFYGNPVAGEHTGNGVLFTHQASRRFRAEKTGFINGVRYNNRTLTQANISDRCETTPDSVWCRCENAGLDEYTCGYHLGNSYSVGNGGSISIEIQADDGSPEHLPTGVSLAKTATPFIPLDHPEMHYPKFDFVSPAQLQAGSIYHIVYKQLNPPNCIPRGQTTSNAFYCDRDKGAVGLNGIHFRNISDALHRFGPWHGDTSAILTQQEANGEWVLNKNNLSWLEVRYTDGTWIGDSVARYASDVEGKGGRTFGATKQVRQKFTVTKASRNIDGIWIYARKLLSNSGNITVKLASENGTVIATTTLQANDFELCATACSRWVYADLSSTMLENGATYTLTLTTNKNESYHIGTGFPLDYGSYQSTARNVWKDAAAEYSSNSGTSWQGFAGSTGNYFAKRDLGLLFTIVGKPRFLP
jgi:hypothetical protein